MGTALCSSSPARRETLFPLDVPPKGRLRTNAAPRYDCAPATKAGERPGRPLPSLLNVQHRNEDRHFHHSYLTACDFHFQVYHFF